MDLKRLAEVDPSEPHTAGGIVGASNSDTAEERRGRYPVVEAHAGREDSFSRRQTQTPAGDSISKELLSDLSLDEHGKVRAHSRGRKLALKRALVHRWLRRYHIMGRLRPSTIPPC